MKTLKELLNAVDVIFSANIENVFIENLTADSRNIEKNALFFAIKGTSSDGHTYIEKAIQAGAKAILVEVLPKELTQDVAWIQVKDSAEAMGKVAANFWDNPSKNLKLTGVTGTNGKTTTVTLLFDLFRGLGYNVGLISTVKNQINEQILPSTHTTPDVLALQALLARMVAEECEYVFMEVSSHGIDQKRIAGVNFVGAVFTNITHDHLDYHKTFDNYIKAKKAFFDQLPSDAFALVNNDDKRGQIMLQNCAAKHHTFGLKSFANFHARLISDTFEGLCLAIHQQEVWFRMVGEFNAYNLLGVFAAATLLGQNELEVLRVLSGLRGAEGRLEVYHLPNHAFAVIDYAHTPDALENVLRTLQDVRTGNQRIFTLVGCGGNRDKEKRPKMARIAFLMSDLCILTSDNPRNENPTEILDDMKAGIKDFGDLSHLHIIEDRKNAIHFAFQEAKKGDIILIAGKGHENYQEINGVKHHFSDKEEVLKLGQEILG